jgi:hypothetical protein
VVDQLENLSQLREEQLRLLIGAPATELPAVGEDIRGDVAAPRAARLDDLMGTAKQRRLEFKAIDTGIRRPHLLAHLAAPWPEAQRHAENELPLVDELIPFLMARSGQALDEFGRWVAPRRPLEWVLAMLKYLPMSMPTRQELLWRFGKVDGPEDPEIEAR